MIIVYCEKCGGYTPEGFAFCPLCMKESGADESAVKAVEHLLDIVNIINMSDTGISQRAAIESILKIAERKGLNL